MRACVTAGYEVHAVQRVDGPGMDRVTTHVADLADDAALTTLGDTLARLGSVSLLVHAAGGFERGDEVEMLDQLFRINVRAPMLLTQALLPALRRARGDVVFVNSSVAVRPTSASLAAYGASRHAMRALADAVRAAENENGVRVTSVFLGRTAGRLQERLHAAEGRDYDPSRLLQPDDVARVILDAASLPATAEATEIHLRPRHAPPANG